jgi:hypothetical protein
MRDGPKKRKSASVKHPPAGSYTEVFSKMGLWLGIIRKRNSVATVVIGKIAFEFPIQFPILLGGDVLGVMEFFSFTI